MMLRAACFQAACKIPCLIRSTRLADQQNHAGQIKSASFAKGKLQGSTGMFAVLMRRLAAVPLVLLLASLFVFPLPTLTGVDLARATARAMPGGARPANAAKHPQGARARPALCGCASAFSNSWLVGDFGFSYSSRQPVGPTVFKALSISKRLCGTPRGIAVLCAVPLGLLAAAASNRCLTAF